MIYSASLVFPGDGPPVQDGWIQVEGNRITATGSASGLPAGTPVERFEDCALLPGLVNLHCHLELTGLHEALEAGKPFPEWVGQLRERTTGFTPADYREAAREGVRQLIAGGCTTLLDVGNTGEALAVLAEPENASLRAFACIETLGLDPSLAAARYETSAARADETAATPHFHPGLAPHAAYSMSPELLRRVIAHQTSRGLPVTIHAAESREEAALFAAGSGPLAEYCRAIFPNAPRHLGTSPVRWLEANGLLPDGLILVHGNTLDAADMEILARRKATVVHCPSSHAFFGHPRFPYEALRERGINVGLGTDSLASGDSLSMVEQMRLFQKSHPDVPLEDVVAMATVNGARALGLQDVGLLKAGYRADIVVVRTGSDNQPEGARASVLQSGNRHDPK
jgi:cytosine/adenosine deaminase-related metal-dependent hydrolase